MFQLLSRQSSSVEEKPCKVSPSRRWREQNSCDFYLEEKLSSLLHDLLDLEEARRVHEQELVPDVHAETPRVAERQDLLEALRLHGWGQLHHRALPPGVKQIPEVGAAGCQHGAVGLGGKQQGKHRVYKMPFTTKNVTESEMSSLFSQLCFHLKCSQMAFCCLGGCKTKNIFPRV